MIDTLHSDKVEVDKSKRFHFEAMLLINVMVVVTGQFTSNDEEKCSLFLVRIWKVERRRLIIRGFRFRLSFRDKYKKC